MKKWLRDVYLTIRYGKWRPTYDLPTGCDGYWFAANRRTKEAILCPTKLEADVVCIFQNGRRGSQ